VFVANSCAEAQTISIDTAVVVTQSGEANVMMRLEPKKKVGRINAVCGQCLIVAATWTEIDS